MNNIDPYHIYKIFKQIDYWVKKEFDVKKGIFPRIAYKRLKPDFLKNPYRKIWNDIQNNNYTLKQLILSICYSFLENSKPLSVININYIENVTKNLSKKRLFGDKKIIKTLSKELKINDIKDYFTLDSSGKTIIFNLIRSGHISPVFFIAYQKFYNENQKYKESNEHKQFRKIIKIMVYFLKK